MAIHLVIPAFIAGIFMFLAPCTLPLVPAYLSFIGGVSPEGSDDGSRSRDVRRRILLNGVFYVIGFTTVFMLLGGIFGLGGAALSRYRDLLARLGGLFIILFGLYLMRVVRLPMLRFLDSEHRLSPARYLRPGRPLSAAVFGATFAMGWSPCVGPILASVLLLAGSSETFLSGAMLLLVFSAGLAVPFLLIAAGIGSATTTVRRVSRIMPHVSIAGGLFLTFLGILMATGSLGVWSSFIYRSVDVFGYDAILDHL